ncbi:hypothetical protein JSQ81_08700 [Sporosarcina sp. Marseille-Q4063]|uniref:hypothetical protein n=1 Tax=Sporosarcina sp. Marseille-Q4063 TaxID=2810514 RepID=UPI001BAFD471|nr:hypothetical protein [Sporosarcina sp. Marseille-Q4063]QUW23564.1 hypothetical protein JSQ81_08700 [Sporosarcina sp. Marseille-Q4063]
MKRNIRKSEKALLFGFSLLFLFMMLHDWVPLGSLNDIQAVSAESSKKELVIVTSIGAMQILLVMTILLFFIGKNYPIWAKLWLFIHPSCIFVGAMMSWWIPYLFGFGAEERAERYQVIFGNTHSLLPVKNGIVPNTLHSLFHMTLLLCIILVIYITSRKKSPP